MTVQTKHPSPAPTGARKKPKPLGEAAAGDAGLSLPDLPPQPKKPYDPGELKAVLLELAGGGRQTARDMIVLLASEGGLSLGGAKKIWYGTRGISLPVTLLLHHARRRRIYNVHKNERRRRKA